MSALNKLKFSALMIVALLLALLWSYLKGKHAATPQQPRQETVLKPNEKEKVSVNTNTGRVTITTPKGSDVKRGVRNVQITEDDNGTIEVSAAQFGFTFEPGLSLFASSGHMRLGPDLSFLYWHDFTLLVGAGVALSSPRNVVGYLGIGYSIPVTWLANTDLVVGLDTNKSPSVGLRLSF